MPADRLAKLILSFTIVFADLLRGFVQQPWLEDVDLSTIEPVKTDHTSDKGVTRFNDMVWKIRKRNGDPLYVLVMLEVQSRVEHFMAVRMNMYVGLLYDVLVRSGQIEGGKVPQVVPLVLYGGERKWNAPLELTELIAGSVRGMEQYSNQFNYHLVSVQDCKELDPSRRNVADAWFRALRARDYQSASAALKQLIEVLDGPEHARLRAIITEWFLDVMLELFLPKKELGELKNSQDLVEVRQMLSENIVKWSEEWIAKGEARGLAKGEAKGLAKGEARGQRSMLVRQAQARFGTGAATEFADQLDRVNSPETLGAIGEWLVTCSSSEALLAKMRQA